MNTFHTINPASEEVLQEYSYWEWPVIEKALQDSKDAYEIWRLFSIEQRIGKFEKLVVLLEKSKERLSLLMTREMGKAIAESRAEVDKCAWLCRYYIENGEGFLAPREIESDASQSYVRFDPMGTILAIMPWNFPLWQVFRAAVPAMIAGNAVMLKHAINVMGSAESIEALFVDAGFPVGTFLNVKVQHQDIEAVIHHRQIAGVALTGSVGAGSAVARIAGAAIKPCVLELGGSDAFIVMEDADIDAAVEAGTFSRMLNNGQSCIAAKRFLIQESIYDIFVEKMVSKVREFNIGDPLDEKNVMGPMARRDLLEEIDRQVLETIENGGKEIYRHPKKHQDGYYFPPVIVGDIRPEHSMFIEEIFGPAVALTRVKDLEEAIRFTNMSEFGLGASLWMGKEVSAETLSRIDTGYIAVNGFVKSDPRLPFGGTKKSGYGRELSEFGIHAFVNKKTIWVA